jgi:hypothetical protein
MPNLGTILLVEPDSHLQPLLAEALQRQGYHVWSVAAVSEARDLLQQQAIHVDLAIIGVSNPDDGREGVALAQELDIEVHKLLISTYIGFFDGLRLAHKTRFFNKQRGLDALLNEIAFMFRQFIRLNHDLLIELSQEWQLRDLLRMVKPYRQLPADTLHDRERELRRLLQRLFFREAKVKLMPLSTGKGGAGVVRVRPYYRVARAGFHKGAEIVLKFGQRDALAQELANYREYVETFTGMQSTDVVGDIVQTRHLAGVKFRFLGANKAPVREFGDIFADHTITNQQIADIIDQMFRDSCALWYVNKYKPEASETSAGTNVPLANCYDDQLDIFDPMSWAEMEAALAGMIDGHLFSRASDETLLVNLPYGREAYPDPLFYLSHHRDELPLTSFFCITHGDLHERNIFVDGNFDTWLLDFTRTGPSTALRDLVQLESVIKFHLLPHEDVSLLLAFEKWLNEAHTFSASIARVCPFSDPWLQRAYTAVCVVRQFASELLETDDMREYEAGLLFQAIKMITRNGLTRSAVQRRPSRQRHALFAALCHTLSISTSNEQKPIAHP